MAQLLVQNVSHYYGKNRALHNVHASLSNGIVALIGPNGAGKTTLIHLMVGLLEPSEGAIFLDGNPIHEMGCQYYSHIGYCPQSLHFYPNYTAEEFLMYMGTMKGLHRKELRVRIPRLLEKMNLLPQQKVRINALSGGMKQRLGIAQALLHDPAILVLDEPTAGLDPCERTRFRNLLSQLSAERIIVIATHIISDIENIANQVLFLRAGELVANGTPGQVLAELVGHVWMARSVGQDTLERISRQYIVSNVRKNAENCFDVKMIGDGASDTIFLPEPATLEDAFLYHFYAMGEGSHKCGILLGR